MSSAFGRDFDVLTRGLVRRVADSINPAFRRAPCSSFAKMAEWRASAVVSVTVGTLLFLFVSSVFAYTSCTNTVMGYYPDHATAWAACTAAYPNCDYGFVDEQYVTDSIACSGTVYGLAGTSYAWTRSADGTIVYYFVYVVGTAQGVEKSLGRPKPGQCTGDPCDAGTGNEYQTEEDYHSSDGNLVFTRAYNSQASESKSIGLGFNWTSSAYRHLEISGATVQLRRADGRGEPFTCPSSGSCQGDSDTQLLLSEDASGYVLTRRDGGTERYDLTGQLKFEISPAGQQTNYAYDGSGRLSTVTDAFGHTLTFGYNANNDIATVTDSASNVISYSYDTNDNLTRVNYPDTTTKIYYYEDPNNPHGLTGIAYVDANNVTTRFATFGYYYNSSNVSDPSNGKAILTEHAQTDNGSPQEKFTLAYGSPAVGQTTVTDPAGMQNVMTFATNLGVMNLTANVNQSDGLSLTQAFDTNNNLTCRKDEAGHVTTYTYNSTNQKLSMTEGQGGDCSNPPSSVTSTSAARTVSYQYLSPTLDLPILITTPSVYPGQNKTTTIQYTDPNHPNLPTIITQAGFTPSGAPVSRSVALSYNTHGQVSSIDGPRTDVNDVTTLVYNDCTIGYGCGQLSRVTNALGHVTTYDSYDANGRLLQMTDPNGLKTAYTYDARGRVKTVTLIPLSGTSAQWQYSYTVWGDVSQVIDPDGVVLNYGYDAAHYLRTITDAAGNQIRYAYDLKGNRTQDYTYDPSGNLTRSVGYAYDLRNHLSQINLAGNTTQLVYDAVGNLTQEIDPNTHTTGYQYDALNRLYNLTDALTQNTGYDYDVNDNPKAVTAPNNLSTQYSYDDLGNRLQEVSPDRGTINYTYDAAGNALTITDARNITATYTYDALNRVVTKISSDSNTPNYTYYYDSAGRLSYIYRGSTSNLIFGYDSLGRRNYQLDLTNLLYSSYVFSPAGRLTQISYPNNRTVNYTYDTVGRVSQVSATVNGTTTVLAQSFHYYPFGPINSFSFGNGQYYFMNVDQAYRPTFQRNGPRLKYAFYDPAGNLSSLNDINNTIQSFSYDPLNELTSASNGQAGSYGSLSYSYLSNGNCQSETRNGMTTTYTYNPVGTNWLYTPDSRIKGNDGAPLYTTALGTLIYDGYGRLTRALSGAATYDYDAFDVSVRPRPHGIA